MTKLTKYEKMDIDQLKEQQVVLREKLKNGMTFGQKAWSVLKGVFWGTVAGGGAKVVGEIGLAVQEAAEKKARASGSFGIVIDKTTPEHVRFGSAVVSLCVAIPSIFLNISKDRERIQNNLNTAYSHVERLLKEKAGVAQGQSSGPTP